MAKIKKIKSVVQTITVVYDLVYEDGEEEVVERKFSNMRYKTSIENQGVNFVNELVQEGDKLNNFSICLMSNLNQIEKP